MATLKANTPISYTHVVAGQTTECEGVVWSAGPTAGTYWVLRRLDARTLDRRAVLVKVPTSAQRERGAKPHVVEGGASPAERTALLMRVQRIAKAGKVFGAADPQQLTLNGEQAVAYHWREDCPALAGKSKTMRYGRPDTLPAYRATDVLLGKRAADIALCPTCIYDVSEVPA
jgi:hypothetical protein